MNFLLLKNNFSSHSGCSNEWSFKFWKWITWVNLLKIWNLKFYYLSATPITPDSAPIPSSSEPTQENNGEQQEEEEEEEDAIQTNQPEPITTDIDNETQDIIEKSDRDSPPRLPDDFYYDANKIHAKPLTTDERTYPENTLTL
jgi:hypothetical protein